MQYNIIKVYQGQITDEENDLTLLQLCKMSRSTPELIIEMMNEGIIYPEHDSSKRWRFSFKTLERIQKVIRLRHDLQLNIAGVALSMHLLDRIEELESKLKSQKF